MQPLMKWDLFREFNEQNLAACRKSLLRLMEVMTQHDEDYFATHPGTPAIYDQNITGIPGYRNNQYIPEVNTEEWLDIPNIFREGGGDCEDQSSYLAACYRQKRIIPDVSVLCRNWILWKKLPGGGYRFHGVDMLPETWEETATGTRLRPSQLEDPSSQTGMLHYYDYLMGSLSKRQTADLFEQFAQQAARQGNTRAAATLRLRIRQLNEPRSGIISASMGAMPIKQAFRVGLDVPDGWLVPARVTGADPGDLYDLHPDLVLDLERSAARRSRSCP